MKIVNYFFFFKYIILILFACSCNPKYYSPNSANVPLLVKENDISLSGSVTTGENLKGGELQLAYAIDSNYALLLNAFKATADEDGGGQYYEIGYGNHKLENNNSNFFMDLFLLAGIGSITNERSEGKIKNQFYKIATQGNFGYSFKYLDITLVAKFSYIKFLYYELNLNYNSQSYLYDDTEILKNKPYNIRLEPSIIIRAGSNNFKLYIQATQSNSLIWSKNNLKDDMQNIKPYVVPLIFNLGVLVSF